MSGLRTRALIALSALTVLILGLIGAYSYGEAYYKHRGFTALVQLPRAGTGRLLGVHFYSQALHRKADYLVYLPPHYGARRHYAVYYLLHGMPGQPKVFIDIANMDVRLDNQLSEGHVKPMILVYPDGRIGGSVYSDSEWANTRSGAFENYVIEVVRDVDHRFSTLPDRADRVIGGFSAGAYGAINIALHHLSVFGSVQVWSGYFIETRSGVFADASKTDLAYNSPLEYLQTVGRRLAAEPLRVYMLVGRDDQSAAQIVPMARALRADGAHVSYTIYRGGHDWSVWYPRLNAMLVLASHEVSRPPAPATPTARHAGDGAGASRARSPYIHRPRPPQPTGHRRAVARHRRAVARHRRAVARHHRGVASHGRGIATHRRQAARAHADLHLLAPAAYPPLTAAPPLLHRTHRTLLLLIGALLLALISAIAINVGFVLQHRGLATERDAGRRSLTAAVRNRSWLAGQAIGWIGFVTQIVAVAIAPLSLVQAFAAGGLGVSVPLAARVFGYRVPRAQLLAVLLIGVSLFTLPIGFRAGHGILHGGELTGLAAIALVAAVWLALSSRAATRAIAAGVFYGIADAAIKADAVTLGHHGAGALLSGWTLLAVVGTFAGFLSFQSALRDNRAVNAISLMNASAAIAALALGVLVFGESLGTTRTATIVHLVAVAVVLACLLPLVRTQQQLTGVTPVSAPPRARIDLGRYARRAIALAGGSVASALMVSVCSLVGLGLLYGLRGRGWFAFGPAVSDSLPLLQLAGFDGQPLLRVIVAWIPAGAVLGLMLVRLKPIRRPVLIAALGLFALLVLSDASFALARNLRFEQVAWNRTPPFGPWLEAILLAVGGTLPWLVASLRRPAAARLRPTTIRSALDPADRRHQPVRVIGGSP